MFLQTYGANNGKAWISELHRTQHERNIKSSDDVMKEGEMRQYLKGFNATKSRRTRFSFVDSGALVDFKDQFQQKRESRKTERVEDKNNTHDMDGDVTKTTSYVRKSRRKSLPGEWQAIKDQDSGDIFYFNNETKKTQWDIPSK